ncbi:polyprenyl synthetase family protein [Candidatus Lokiarchaeum ossiferum]|uniref:polyprenyl synthetase family protein n=1 Tax=Candidatus Lokiarchaeum ossiferum TaxID=2951803 RepID=UPI00352EB80E
MDEKLIKLNISQTANKVDQFLSKRLTGKIKNLWDAANHYILGGGKRLRPFLVIESFKLNQPYIDNLIPIASAVEILHTFTLIHDDIMDNDPIRRGIPTVHTKWNESIAILAGDLLSSMSTVLVNESQFSPDIKSNISLALGNVGIDLCEGQTMDMNFENRTDVSVEEYFEMIKLKTGALFKTSVQIGAIAGEFSKVEIEALEQYGISLGIAFQLVDDILGIIGNVKDFGKPIGSDLREGKKTFILLYALEHLNSTDLKNLKTFLDKKEKSDLDVQKALDLIKRSGAISEAKQIAKKHASEAKKTLSIFPESEAKDNLVGIAELATTRTN